MIFDKEELFTWSERGVNAQEILDTDTRSVNTIDVGDPFISKGDKLVEVFAQVVLDFDSTLDTSTLQVQLCTHDALPVSGGIVLANSGVIAQADLIAGYQFSFGTLPVNALQYLDLNFVVGVASFTAGKIICGLILDRQGNLGS